MAKANVELFEAWNLLALHIRQLASAVQNDCLMVTMDDLTTFKRRVKEARAFLNSLESDTIIHLIGDDDATP